MTERRRQQAPFPTQGGTYRHVDGQLIPEGEISNDDPSAPEAPLIDQAVDHLDSIIDMVERVAKGGDPLPPIEPKPAPAARGRRNRTREE